LDIYPKEWWLPLQSNGEIYAVSAYGSNVKEEGLLIRGDVLEALNLDKEEIVGDFECKKNITIQEVATVLNPVLEKVAESDVVLENGMAVKDMKLVQGANGYGGIFSQCQLIEYEGFGNTLGCVVNQSGEVVNLYETTEYRDMLKLAKEWQQAGYIYNTDEQLTENPIMTYEMGRSLGLFSDTTQGMEERLTYFTGYPTESISLKEKVLTSEAQQLGNWVIPQSSEKKEAAMKILNLMYTSEEYVNLYFYGLEGVHYTRDEKGCVCRISGRYIQNLTWMFGNTFLAWQEEGEAPRVPDDLEDIVYSPYYGFVYDGQKYEDEIYEMEKILDAYLPELEKGNYDDISVLDEMNQRLYAAGLKEVMEDKEAQLKEWIVSQ